MPSSNLLDILVRHDRWATRLIMEKCAELTAEQFNQKFEMGRGSLQENLSHILGAQRGWCDLLAGREVRFKLDEISRPRTPGELLALLDEIGADFAAQAVARPLDEILSRVREGKTYSFTRGAVVTHVTTHAMHHRAQCLNMLRHLGVSPLPPSSVMEWTWLGDKE